MNIHKKYSTNSAYIGIKLFNRVHFTKTLYLNMRIQKKITSASVVNNRNAPRFQMIEQKVACLCHKIFHNKRLFLFFTGLLFSISFNLQLRIVICIVINRKLAWWLVFHYLDKVPNADINTCAELPYCSDFLLYSEQYPNSVVLHTQMVSLLLYEYCG